MAAPFCFSDLDIFQNRSPRYSRSLEAADNEGGPYWLVQKTLDLADLAEWLKENKPSPDLKWH